MRGARAPEIAATLGSLALSAAVLARRQLPNNDGVYYLLAAEAFARDGLGASSAIHPWPFYSVLIAGAATLFGVSTEAAAHGIGALLLATASTAFVAVVRALGADRTVAWLATAVVLCHPWLNRTRALIVRDAGVWAFGLLALLLVLRSERGRRVSALGGWAACSALAVLFRPDASALMAGGAIAVAIAGDMERKKRWAVAIALLVPALLAAGSAVAWLSHHPTHPGGLMSLGPFDRGAAALAASFPLPYGREYAPYILAWGLLVIPLVKTFNAAGVAHAALSVVGVGQGAALTGFQRAALLATLGAALVPLYLQVMRLLFLEGRYTVFATLVLSVWAPFGLGWLLRPGGPGGRRAAGGVLALALFASLALNLPVRPPPEDHVLAAANWIRLNGRGARLHTNSLQLAYESGAPVVWNLVNHAQVHGALDGVGVAANEVWAVRIAPGDTALGVRLSQTRKFRPAASFVGADGDAVLIFRCAAEVCLSGE